MTLRASAVSAVERKRPWLKLRHADPAIWARETRRVKSFVAINHRDENQSSAKFHGQRYRLFQPVLDSGLHQQSVDNHFDGVVLALVECEIIFQIHQFAIHPGAGEAVLDQFLHLLFELAFAAANNGCHDHDAVIRRERQNTLYDLLGRLTCYGLAAIWTMGNAD